MYKYIIKMRYCLDRGEKKKMKKKEQNQNTKR